MGYKPIGVHSPEIKILGSLDLLHITTFFFSPFFFFFLPFPLFHFLRVRRVVRWMAYGTLVAWRWCLRPRPSEKRLAEVSDFVCVLGGVCACVLACESDLVPMRLHGAFLSAFSASASGWLAVQSFLARHFTQRARAA